MRGGRLRGVRSGHEMLKLKAYWYVLRLFIRCRGDGDLMLAEARRKIEEIRLDILTDSYWRGHDPPSP